MSQAHPQQPVTRHSEATIAVCPSLWEQFESGCLHRGTSASIEIRRFMVRKVKQWEREEWRACVAENQAPR